MSDDNVLYNRKAGFRYNQIVQNISIIPVISRLVLAGILIAVLNLSPQPHSIRREWEQARSAMESWQPGIAAASLDRIALSAPWRSDLRWAAARFAFQANEWQLGIQWMGMLAPTSYSSADWLQLGDAHAARGNLLMAEQSWRQSILLEPSFDGYLRLYEVHSQENNVLAVTEDLQYLVALKPDDERLAYQLALHLAALDPAAAINQLEQFSVTSEEWMPHAAHLERKLKRAMRSSLTEVQFLAAGQALADLQEWDLAKTAIQKALQINPDYAEAWSLLGEARQHLSPSETDQALVELRQGLRLKPDSVVAISLLALYWQRQGDLPRAADLYRSAAALEPKNPAWFAALGGIANSEGELQTAEWYYLYAVRLAPTQATYFRLLANFYIINQIQIQVKALQAAQQAVKLDPADPSNLDILGQVFLLMDETEDARYWFQQALEIDPAFAPAHLHIGIIELFQGQFTLAHQHLESARDMATDTATFDQASRLLSYYFP